jgi:hypothetical protein
VVDNIYNVILNIIGLGLYDYYQANVNIYDNDNKLIYKGKTYNSKLYINLIKGNVYKLIATTSNNKLISSFYVLEGNNEYIFILNKNTKEIKTITFLLRDANYNNLPVEKGMITFVKNN